MPILSADRGPLHLEARYNYEDLKTASLFAGSTFAFGGDVAFEVTPTLGGVFGRTGGVALGLELDVAWWKLELYSENEYVFETAGRGSSFFYSWTETSIRPVEALVAGVRAHSDE